MLQKINMIGIIILTIFCHLWLYLEFFTKFLFYIANLSCQKRHVRLSTLIFQYDVHKNALEN